MKTERSASHYRVCHPPCVAHLPSVQSLRAELEHLLEGMEDATMPRVKQASKKRRVTKAAVPALGAAGLTFSLAGGASASAVPTDVQQTNNFSPTQSITLGEEEIRSEE